MWTHRFWECINKSVLKSIRIHLAPGSERVARDSISNRNLKQLRHEVCTVKPRIQQHVSVNIHADYWYCLSAIYNYYFGVDRCILPSIVHTLSQNILSMQPFLPKTPLHQCKRHLELQFMRSRAIHSCGLSYLICIQYFPYGSIAILAILRYMAI